jgi:16S rRNA (guanine527-N7)-methyltransferase
MNEVSAEDLDVSRETFDRLGVFAGLLCKWNPTINLVSRSSIADLWTRHIADSVQVFECAPKGFNHWVDLGSGGGFPGLVAAICALENGGASKFTLVESDTRKATFLRTVAREVGVNVSVVTERIENLEISGADIVSARALASLPKLLGFAEKIMSPNGYALLPKGASWRNELAEAQAKWHFDYEAIDSKTEQGAVIIKVKGLTRG